MNRREIGGFLVGFLVSVFVFVPTPSQAHPEGTFFDNGKWPSLAVIHFRVRNGFPSAAYTSRINDGFHQWNVGSTSLNEPDFLNDGTTSATGNFDNPCASTYNGVYWRNLDYINPDTLGATIIASCSGTRLTTFQLSIDSNTTWYTGTGDAPSSSSDLWSTTSHEFGHATGFWEHLDERGLAGRDPSLCPNDGTRHTMCQFYVTGTERQRTLAPHDLDTFNAAY